MPKQHQVEINNSIKSNVSLEGTGFKAGLSKRTGWFHWFKVGTEPQRGSPGAFAIVEKVRQRLRFGNRWREKVIDAATGEVIVDKDGPLDQHQDAGSAKKSPPST